MKLAAQLSNLTEKTYNKLLQAWSILLEAFFATSMIITESELLVLDNPKVSSAFKGLVWSCVKSILPISLPMLGLILLFKLTLLFFKYIVKDQSSHLVYLNVYNIKPVKIWIQVVVEVAKE